MTPIITRRPPRLLLIQGDFAAIYEGRQRLAVFAGASNATLDNVEQVRLMSKEEIDSHETPKS